MSGASGPGASRDAVGAPEGRSPIRAYLGEMYPPLPRLLLATVWFYALYLGLAAYHGDTVPLLGPVPVVGVLTYFFFLLFLRLSDEWKDWRVDRVHFPDRPVPSGRVPLRWIRGMWIATLTLLALLQLPLGGPSPAFLVLLGYALLMFRYFFLERWIASNLLLAFVTHNPVGFLLNVYGAWIVSGATGHPPLQPFHLGLAVLLWLPTAVWEVARKIRAPSRETTYQTYSAILGPRRAAGLAAVAAGLFAGLGLVLAGPIGLGPAGRGGLVIATLYFVWRCVRFAASPSPERAGLETPAELWAMAALAVWCADLLATQPGAWTLL